MNEADHKTTKRWSVAASVRDAVNFVSDHFPFNNYMSGQSQAYVNISKTIMSHLAPSKDVKILDFGCGPCDKTAVLSALGYQCFGYDDLQDDWHKIPENREAIKNFAAAMEIDFRIARGIDFPWAPNTFDLLMLNDIVEHLHNSPRTLLNSLLQLVKEEGILLITVPNAVNIRKRIDVLLGRTNYPPYNIFYWYPDPWRGHIREYTKEDLRLLAKNLDLTITELHSCDDMVTNLPGLVRPFYLAVTAIFRGWKDSWLLIAKKEKGWKPREMSRAEVCRLLPQFALRAYPSDAAVKGSDHEP